MTTSNFEIKNCQLEIKLPVRVKINVKEGEKVQEDQVIAETEGDFQEFDLTKILNTKPEKVSDCLIVPIGVKVDQDKVVAQKKSLFATDVFKSPISGKITSLSAEGVLRISQGEKEEIKTPTKGEIIKVTPEVITIEFSALECLGTDGQGRVAFGQIEIVEDAKMLDSDEKKNKYQDKILVLPGKIPCALAYKAEALEAVGIVGSSYEKELKTEEISLLALTENGSQVEEELWEKLKKYQGKKGEIKGEEKLLWIFL